MNNKSYYLKQYGQSTGKCLRLINAISRTYGEDAIDADRIGPYCFKIKSKKNPSIMLSVSIPPDLVNDIYCEFALFDAEKDKLFYNDYTFYDVVRVQDVNEFHKVIHEFLSRETFYEW